ncbi:MAG: hypothetical protein B6D55_03185 [Candidatus Omnitrophica bacterium 4484_70.2]|nr:MAG: hypothetical protein B6D55_03185 [Candidatus Omnitrophica bacterium 4484_70.2]
MFKIINVKQATFIYSPFSGFNTASLGIFVRGGARLEEKKVKGVAHFVEHMLFKGSKNFSYKEIKREIEGRGGTLNGFTSQEVTAFYAYFLKKNLKITLEILLDMILNPLFEEKELEKERKVILEEIKMYNDLPSYRALSLLDKILWEGHPLGEDIIGDFSTVGRISRQDLIRFKEAFYQPKNFVIGFVGDVDEKEVVKLLEKKLSLGKIPKRKKLKSPYFLKKIKTVTEEKKLDQTHLCIGFRAPSYRSRLRFAAELIHVILGANMSSRLFEELRERKGLCYEVSSEVKKYKDSGAFIIHTGLDKEKVVLALDCILKELKKIKEKRVSRKELARAKDYFLGQLSMSMEKPQSRLFYLVESYIALDKILVFKEIEECIHKIDSSLILNLANKIFDFSKVCISCVGNIDKDVEERIRKTVGKYC